MPIVCLINSLPKDTSFFSKCEQVPSQPRVSALKCPRMPPADPYSNSHHTPVGRVVADFVGAASAPARPQGSQAPFLPDGHFN